uniref:MI domain-containing protein n=1 Tax=Rhabditophanes sp. KR3021 TaxID=114890 RepID=A0AC35TUD7_9BILA
MDKKSTSQAKVTGGTYIPPAIRKRMMEQTADKSSEVYQRMAWENLKNKIQGAVNKLNKANIVDILKELMEVNIIRGKGVLVKALIMAQVFSPTFSNVYAAFVAVINSKFPDIGELVVKRLIIQFKRNYASKDKANCMKIMQFIAHLTNQNVVHEILALQILIKLMEPPTNDSIEMCVSFMKEVGKRLTDVCPKGVAAVFDKLRSVLDTTPNIEVRIQCMIEVLFQARKEKFGAHPDVIEELDLIEEDDQVSHTISLTDTLEAENILNVFKFDPDYLESERQYTEIKHEILGDDSGDEEEAEEDGSDHENKDDEASVAVADTTKTVKIIDMTAEQLTEFRKKIYLTFQSSIDHTEAAHKILKNLYKPGCEKELCDVILDACAEDRVDPMYYAKLATTFCTLKLEFQQCFESLCRDIYTNIHRFPLPKLPTLADFVAHLLLAKAISWEILGIVRITDEDTNPYSRIFLKQFFLKIVESLGLAKFYRLLMDKTLRETAFKGIFFPQDPQHIKFAINYFTAIDLGQLTLDMREKLKNIEEKAEVESSSDSSDDDSSDSDSSDSSVSSDSD